MNSISSLQCSPFFILILITLNINIAVAHVSLQGGGQYDSQPAAFGKMFQYGVRYGGRIQVVRDDPYLCGADSDGNIPYDLPERQEDKIIVPPDGAAVVLLAKKGLCSYERKARVAMLYGPVDVVQYVLVYDDIPEGDKLITMFASKNPRGITVGLQYISFASGVDILHQLNEESAAERHAGGLLIILDSFTDGSTHYSYLGVLMIMTSFICSLCSCCTSGYIRRDGSVVIIGQNQRPEPILLTNEDISRLPEIEFIRQDTNSTDNPKSDPDTKTLDNNDKNSTSESVIKEYIGDFENSSCCVCLDDYDSGDKLIVLPCKHMFHSRCIKPWLTERQATCPLCKASVFDALHEEDNNNSEETNLNSGTQSTDQDRETLVTRESSDGVNPSNVPSLSRLLRNIRFSFSQPAAQEENRVPLLEADESPV